MNRTYKIFLTIFILALAFLSYLEATKPEPLNWNPSYTAVDNIPLGSLILFENLNEQTTVEKVTVPPFEFLQDSTVKGTYFFVNNQLPFDDSELQRLLSWVEKGNSLFLATDAFGKNLLDTLGLNVETLVPDEGISSKPMFNLLHPNFKKNEAYLFDQEIYHSVFHEIDTLNHSRLGTSQLHYDSLEMTDPRVNFVRVSHGKGEILLHTAPQVFSNYFILYQDNVEYVENALGFLPTNNKVYWDTHYKAGKTFQTSPLYILLNNEALKWAYYFVLLGALLFIIFEGKRKQRYIPVIEPLKNQTFQFTKTVADLFLERKDFKGIASKKIDLFLEYIRSHYRISTETINEKFYQDLSTQSESPIEDVKNLFQHIKNIQSRNIISKEDLLDLNTKINSIKAKDNGK